MLVISRQVGPIKGETRQSDSSVHSGLITKSLCFKHAQLANWRLAHSMHALLVMQVRPALYKCRQYEYEYQVLHLCQTLFVWRLAVT